MLIALSYEPNERNLCFGWSYICCSGIVLPNEVCIVKHADIMAARSPEYSRTNGELEVEVFVENETVTKGKTHRIEFSLIAFTIPL